MKKKLLIAVFIPMVLIILILGSFIVLRHEIIRHSLNLTLSQTHHTYLSMEVGDIIYSPFSSDLTLKDLHLNFDNLELDTSNHLQLKRISFKEIYLKNISIWHLVAFKELQTRILLIKNPIIRLNSKQKNQSPTIHRFNLPAILSSKNKSKSRHPVKIDNLTIEGGQIDLEQFTNDTNSEWKFDYQITFTDFNTEKDLFSDTSRFLYSKTANITLKNISHTNPSGEEVKIDSLRISSNPSGINLFGMTFLAHGDNHHFANINGYIKHAKTDLRWPSGDNLQATPDFRAIKLNSGHLVVTKTDGSQQTNSFRTSQLLKQLKTLMIDTMQISNFDFALRTFSYDTLFCTDIKNIELQALAFDSGFISNPDKISIDHLSWNIGETHIHFPEKRIKSHFNSCTFSDCSGTLTISNLSFIDTLNAKMQSTYFQTDTLAIAGLFISTINTHKPLPLDIKIVNPYLRYKQDLGKEGTTASYKSLKFPEELTMKSLNIVNGSLLYEKSDQFETTAKKLNLTLHAEDCTNKSSLTDLLQGELQLTTENVWIINHKNKQTYYWHDGVMTNDLITMQHIEIKDNENTRLQIPQLKINHFNLNRLITLGYPNTGIITLFNPVFSGNIPLIESGKNKPVNPFEIKEKALISFDGLRIVNGSVNATFPIETDTLSLHTKIDLTTSGYTLTNKMNKNDFSVPDWGLTLSDVLLIHRSGSVEATEINLGKADSNLTIRNLAIEDAEFKTGKVRLNKLLFDELNINSVNYKRLISESLLEFGTLKVSKPTLSIDIVSQSTKPKNNQNKSRQKTDLSQLPFIFQEIQLEKMQLQIAQSDSNSTDSINIGEMDIAVTDFTRQPTTSNLVNHLQLMIKDISYHNHKNRKKFQIDHLKFSPDQNQLDIAGIAGSFQKHVDNEEQPVSLHSVKIDELGLSGLHLSKHYPTTLSVRKIELTNPGISAFHQQSKTTEKEKEVFNTTQTFHLPEMLQQLQIDTVMISNLIYNHGYIGNEHSEASIKGLDISVNQIRIDSSGVSAQNFNFVEEATVDAGNYHLISSDSLYSTNIRRASYNFITNTLTIDSLTVEPRYADELFFKMAHYQTDRLHLFGEKIVCQHLRREKLFEKGQLHFGSIDFFGLEVKLYRDKHYPMDPNSFKKMPQAMMRQSKTIFQVDSIKTHDATIHYKEIVEKSIHPGYIFFTPFNLTLYNITNDLVRIKTDSVARVFLRAKIMGETDLRLTLFLDLNSKNDAFWFTGHTGSIPFTLLNPVTENLVGITMQGGEGRLLIPKIAGDSSYATGTVLFLYKDLKVGLYNREKATSTTGITRGMANILLNDIFIRSNNPVWLRKPKKGMVYFERVDEKSFVFYVWKSVLSGMLSTFGVNSREQRKEKRLLMQTMQ